MRLTMMQLFFSFTCISLVFSGCNTIDPNSNLQNNIVASQAAESAVFLEMVTAGALPSLECHFNVIRVMNKMREKIPSFKIEEAMVLFFHPRDSTDVTFQAFATSRGRFRWFHHVVLVYRGVVYDGNYRAGLRRLPKAVPMIDYLEEMFLGIDDDLPEPENGQKITVKRLSAVQWRDEFMQKIDGVLHTPSFYRSTKKYRPRILDTFISEFNNSPN